MRIPIRRGEKELDRSIDPYLTTGGILELERERERLEKHARPRVLAELQAAQALGDLSENAAYSIAKGRLRGIDARLHEINERLKKAIPIEEGSPDGVVRIGSKVTVRVHGNEKTYHVVGSQEADPSGGKISYLSPLGALLLNHKAGEHVTLESEQKRTEYMILSVA